MIQIKSDFKQWICEQLQSNDFSVMPLRNDASFRSYYRVRLGDFSYVLMDAPPEKEKTDPFVNIANAWNQNALPVPKVHAWNKEKGYVLLSDFGDTLMLDVLNEDTVDHYYRQAIALIIDLQQHAPRALPLFDEHFIRLELSYFKEWYCQKWCHLTLSDEENSLLESVTQKLVHYCQIQPQTVIHRDYHSRNLMIVDDVYLGLIDFQDAMIGPITYDLVSILKDCYIRWPQQKVEQWVHAFYEQAQKRLHFQIDFPTFIKWFDMTGLQRHLKVLGVFSRLTLRDQKSQYEKDMPRVMDYVKEVTGRYEELSAFHEWLNK